MIINVNCIRDIMLYLETNLEVETDEYNAFIPKRQF